MNMGIIAASRLRGTGINPLFENSEAYYKCDGTTSGVLLDSRNSFNGELNGGITQGVTGKIASAVESDGTSLSYLSIPRDTFNENDFSLSFWMYYSSEYSFQRLILRGKHNSNPFLQNAGFVLNIDNNISVVFFGDTSGGLTSNSDLVLNSWNQIVVEKLNDNIKVYTNNVIKINGSKTYTNVTLNDDLYFGTIVNANGLLRSDSSNPFLIDEIDIRKQQYTQQQRDELYNNGNGTTI
jgi:hypothetical protein